MLVFCKFQPGLKFCCDYMKFENAEKSERLPSCFIENTITECAQAHFSAQAEISSLVISAQAESLSMLSQTSF